MDLFKDDDSDEEEEQEAPQQSPVPSIVVPSTMPIQNVPQYSPPMPSVIAPPQQSSLQGERSNSPPDRSVPSTVQPPVQSSAPEILSDLVKRELKGDPQTLQLVAHVKTCTNGETCKFENCPVYKHFRVTCNKKDCAECATARLLELRTRLPQENLHAFSQHLKGKVQVFRAAREAKEEAAKSGSAEQMAAARDRYIASRTAYCETVGDAWQRLQKHLAAHQKPVNQPPPPKPVPSAPSIALQPAKPVPVALPVVAPTVKAPVPAQVPPVQQAAVKSTPPAPTASTQQPKPQPQPKPVQQQPQQTNQSAQPAQAPKLAATTTAPKEGEAPVKKTASEKKAAAASAKSAAAAKPAATTPSTNSQPQKEDIPHIFKKPEEIDDHQITYVLGEDISKICGLLDEENEAQTKIFEAKDDNWFTQRGSSNTREPDWATENILTKAEIEAEAQRVLPKNLRLFSSRDCEFLSRAAQELLMDVLSEAVQLSQHRARSKGSNKRQRLEVTVRDIQIVLQRHPQLQSLVDARDLDGGL